jgi:hypothetical protein
MKAVITEALVVAEQKVSGEICSNTTGQEIHHILWEFKVH